MKIFLLFVLVFSTNLTVAQETLEQLVKPGTALMYRIDLKEKSYDMKVVVKNLKSFEFDYEILDSANAKGTITHTAAGMANGIVLHTNFSGGTIMLDEKTTSLLISKKVFQNLSKHKRRPITMFLGKVSGESNRIGFTTGVKDFKIRVNGNTRTIQQEYARPKIKFHKKYETTGEEYFTFYNSPQLPLILKMRTTFYIELLDIITQ